MNLLLLLALTTSIERPTPCMKLVPSFSRSQNLATLEVTNRCGRPVNLSTAVIRFADARATASWVDVPMYVPMVYWEPIERGFILIRDRGTGPVDLKAGDSMRLHWISDAPAREPSISLTRDLFPFVEELPLDLEDAR